MHGLLNIKWLRNLDCHTEETASVEGARENSAERDRRRRR
jgi:hypothetical protein